MSTLVVSSFQNAKIFLVDPNRSTK